MRIQTAAHTCSGQVPETLLFLGVVFDGIHLRADEQTSFEEDWHCKTQYGFECGRCGDESAGRFDRDEEGERRVGSQKTAVDFIAHTE